MSVHVHKVIDKSGIRPLVEKEGSNAVIAVGSTEGCHVMLVQNDGNPKDAYGEDRIIISRPKLILMIKELQKYLDETQEAYDKEIASQAKVKTQLTEVLESMFPGFKEHMAKAEAEDSKEEKQEPGPIPEPLQDKEVSTPTQEASPIQQ